MVTIETFRELALSFPAAVEQPHFEKTSFRAKNKIFATLSLEKKQACIKLNEIDQSVFSAFDKTVIYPVNNKWGKQGWTIIELSKVRKDMLKDALNIAFETVSATRK